MNEQQNENSGLLSRLKELNEKYIKAVNALDFIAFSNPEIWKPKDRQKIAVDTLLDLGEIKRADKKP